MFTVLPWWQLIDLKTGVLTIFVGIVVVGITLFLVLPNEQQDTCEQLGGKWNVDHCLVTQTMFDSNQLTCDPGPVFEDGYCNSGGIKLVLESIVKSEHDVISHPKEKSPKDTAIEMITEHIMSDSSYDQWRQVIREQVDYHDLEPFSEVILTDMKNQYAEGEKISFNLVNFGYRDWCLMPKVLVYHQDYSLPIYEDAIVHSCPAPMDNPSPRISIWDEGDFRTFPNCQFDGTYSIWAESFEFESQKIGSFYCSSQKEFRTPESFEVLIPLHSSDSKIKSNFTPAHLELRYGDYLKIFNEDDSVHRVILFIDKQASSAILAQRLSPGESLVIPVYDLGTFELVSQDEKEKEYPWMNGVVTVDEN